jgi:hypothetical protein
MAAFWNVTLCSLVDIYCHFKGTYCFHHQVIIVTSQICGTTQHTILDGSCLHIHHCENLKSQQFISCSLHEIESHFFGKFLIITVQNIMFKGITCLSVMQIKLYIYNIKIQDTL